MTFKEWSDKWLALRNQCGNVSGVLNLWKCPRLPQEIYRENFMMPPGYRQGSPRGEQLVEREFLGKGRKEHKLVGRFSRETFKITALKHRVYLANVRGGNRIVDCLAACHVHRAWHPIMVEVKTTDRNPWYAVVENIQQVKIARSNVRLFEKGNAAQLSEEEFRGTWGMVLAPIKYYLGHPKETTQALRLMRRLQDASEGRIMLVAYDGLRQGILMHMGGYWPRG